MTLLSTWYSYKQ